MSKSRSLIPPIFTSSNTEGWKTHLNEYGYVVIKDILTEEEMTEGLEIFRKDMKQVSPTFDFTPATMNIEHLPLMFGKGMAVFNGFGQSDFMWHLRLNNHIQSIFKEVYNTEEIVTSLDGFSMFVSKAQKSKPWLHVDQNPKTDLYSIQGAYNYLPVNSVNDAGFVLVPKSHIEFKPVVDHSKDWIVCKDQEYWLSHSRKLIIPKNCLVLWNSKTIHANEGATIKTPMLNRLTCYVTFLPKSIRKEKYKQERIKAYMEGQTTSHWSNLCQIKRYPYGFKGRYESRGYGNIVATLDSNNDIPNDRYILL